jgi:hypothetical protein
VAERVMEQRRYRCHPRDLVAHTIENARDLVVER